MKLLIDISSDLADAIATDLRHNQGITPTYRQMVKVAESAIDSFIRNEYKPTRIILKRNEKKRDTRKENNQRPFKWRPINPDGRPAALRLLPFGGKDKEFKR